MVKELCDRGPCQLVTVQTLDYEVFCVVRDALPLLAREPDFFAEDVLIDFLNVFAVKWGLA